ncbi:hypothetical protein NKJ09_23245 [Mesorhizobium sp. M0189]|uniref:hypothetical protein n=1 Tax=Mesorhizobium sp. M0189 TaxID=2956909 RepID=UPI00333BB5B4
MIEVLIQAAAAVELAMIAAMVSAYTRTTVIFYKIVPAFLALSLGVHAYGKIMGWPV